MATTPAKPSRPFHQSIWYKIPMAGLHLILATAALWLGMSIPSYFRSVSPLVLEAAAEGTPDLVDQATDHLQSGRPGLAQPLLQLASGEPGTSTLEMQAEALFEANPAYKWSGGPAPFYEQFLKQAAFLRTDETAVIPTLLPSEHRGQLLGFLEESPNRNVGRILQTRELDGWTRFYPVNSTSGQPLDATILATALLEQSGALPEELRQKLFGIIESALSTEGAAVAPLESFYISILTIGRRADWIQLQTLVQASRTPEQLLFAAQSLQEDAGRLPVLLAASLNADSNAALTGYLHRHGKRGWEGVASALRMGRGAFESLLAFDKPLYLPPGFWMRLPAEVRESQNTFKAFAESFPVMGIVARVLAFSLCGFFLVGILRVIILGRRQRASHERRVLINLDSLVGGVLVTLLVWVLIEPGLMDFRPNELGSLQIKLAQVLPEDSLSTTENAVSKMIDQVTILVLLLFFIAQLLVFIFGLLKITEIRRHKVGPEVKLHLLDNEEVLFDLGLYVGLGGTVASLILVVLNVVDASLMAAYASTLFGIIFVAILKVGFLRPYRRSLILDKN
ncbi:MAG: hypothetical protein AB3N33_08430 [Puniceicoccaceae bacterium]